MAIRIQKTCQQCGTTFVLNRNSLAAVQEFCSRECGGAARRVGALKSRYRTVTVPVDHPIASKAGRDGGSGRVLEHRLVLWNKIGPGTHPCHHCGKLVTWTRRQRVQVDSLVGEHLDGDTRNNDPANLVPSCQRCNIKKRHDAVRDDEPHRARANQSRQRGELSTCTHCGEQYVTFPNPNQRYPSLYCSRRCMSSAKRKASTKPCAACGVEFYSSNAKARKYCSAACYHAAHKGRKRGKRPVTVQ